MINEIHCLRPWWLLAMIPVFALLWQLWQRSPQLYAWSKVCDSHLLPYLVENHENKSRRGALLWLFMTSLLLCISLAGPCWFRLPVPVYQTIQPRVLVLDLSSAMLANDLTPNRLTRAKFKLHDLFNRQDVGQLGLVVYTGEPFIVSPLTDDGKTIDSLLQSLSPQIMPVGGQNLSNALDMGADLIQQAGFNKGELLVLTGTPPSENAVQQAKKLAKSGITTSLLPIIADKTLAPLFQPLVKAGEGVLLPFSDTSDDLEQWLKMTRSRPSYQLNEHNNVPVWRDEGRWFVLLALIFLLPVFRQGWLQRIDS